MPPEIGTRMHATPVYVEAGFRGIVTAVFCSRELYPPLSLFGPASSLATSARDSKSLKPAFLPQDQTFSWIRGPAAGVGRGLFIYLL